MASSRTISSALRRMNLLVSTVGVLLACTLFAFFELAQFRGMTLRTLSSEAQIVGANSVSALTFGDFETAAARRVWPAHDRKPHGRIRNRTVDVHAAGSRILQGVESTSGHMKRIEYDEHGRLLSEEVRSNGQLLSSVRWKCDSVAWPAPADISSPVKEERDALGNPTSRVFADGTEATYTYHLDPRGNDRPRGNPPGPEARAHGHDRTLGLS
jgi:YD repeat-containing protein